MRKLITATLISMISFTAHAEYVMKIPLEMANGGTLPNGTINFVKGVPTAPAGITPEECDGYFSDFKANTDPSKNGFTNAGVVLLKPEEGKCTLNILATNILYSPVCNSTTKAEGQRLIQWVTANNKTPIQVNFVYTGYPGFNCDI